jgi:hypothetical protein
VCCALPCCTIGGGRESRARAREEEKSTQKGIHTRGRCEGREGRESSEGRSVGEGGKRISGREEERFIVEEREEGKAIETSRKRKNSRFSLARLWWRPRPRGYKSRQVLVR